MHDQRGASVSDLAALTGKSPHTIRAAVRAGKIQHHRDGPHGQIFFTPADLELYFAATLVPARQDAEALAAADGGDAGIASAS